MRNQIQITHFKLDTSLRQELRAVTNLMDGWWDTNENSCVWRADWQNLTKF